HSLRFGDRCHRSLVPGRGFDDHYIILELDDKALWGPGIQKPEAIGDFLCLDLNCSAGAWYRRDAGAAALGITTNLHGCRAVRLDLRDHHVKNGIPALLLDDMHWEFHAAEIFILGINALEESIAGKSDVDSSLDMLDLILFVDGSRDCVLVECSKRHEFLFSACACDAGMAICERGLQESMWREPDIERADFITAIKILILDDVAGNRPYAALPSAGVEWSCAAAPRWELVVDANNFLTHGRNRVVHQRHILRHLE